MMQWIPCKLQDMAHNIVTVQEVVDEITSKRQLRRLVVLPYDLVIKNVFPENVGVVINVAKKTGDYPALSAVDIKVMALTYQLEKEMLGADHININPTVQKTVTTKQNKCNIAGFYLPKKKGGNDKNEPDKEICDEIQNINISEDNNSSQEFMENNQTDSTSEVSDNEKLEDEQEMKSDNTFDLNNTNKLSQQYSEENLDEINDFSDGEDAEKFVNDDEEGWITPSNVKTFLKSINSELTEDKHVQVACITKDFAMQNVLKQMNLNLCAINGKIIKQLRTFILRCYSCFKTTSIMTKKFCPNCGNNTLKRVAVSVDENGVQKIHINVRRPLTTRGKKFSIPTPQGGKHGLNPILAEDQPVAKQRPTRLARMKNNPLQDDYIAGFSPFIQRDLNSKSALLHGQIKVKHWMKKNPNEPFRKRK